MPQNEPTLALTFNDYILRVAEFLGLADYSTGVAAIPTNAHDLEVCKRLVNDGWRKFFGASPRWNWVLQTFSITFETSSGNKSKLVNNEIWRYYMPDGFYGDMLGKVTYAENSGRLPLEEVTEEDIREAYGYRTHSGYPIKYAIRPLHGDNARRWEMIVWPKPDVAKVVTGRFRAFPNKLIQTTDRPCAGFQFDDAILACCLAEAESQRKTPGVKTDELGQKMVMAIHIDQQSSPSNLGDYGPKAKAGASRSYTGVDSYISGNGTTYDFTV